MKSKSAHTAEQATYRRLFASRDYTAVFAALVVSYAGDQLAGVAVSVLAFNRTGSTLLTAAAYASTYVPWIVGGPLLSPLADRLPRRQLLVTCDVVRAVLFGLLAIPGMPVGILVLLLFLATLMSPPFNSARGALLPQILGDDLYVLGVGLNSAAGQACQLFGFAAGGVLVALLSANSALIVDAGTFVASALLLRLGLTARHAAGLHRPLSPILRDAVDGTRYVFSHRLLRVYLAVFWVASAFAFAFEGLAYPYAVQLGAGTVGAGLTLAAPALGATVAGIVVVRLVPPSLRLRLVMPTALLSCAVLLPVAVVTSVPVALLLFFLAGLSTAYSVVLEALFVRTVPSELRGRAMGIANAGVRASQGVAIVAAGGLAEAIANRGVVITLSGLAGTIAILGLMLVWPRQRNHLER